MEHHVWSPDELRLRSRVLFLPQFEALRQFEFPFRDFTPLSPGADLFRFERYEDAFAAVFYGGNPADFIGQETLASRLAMNPVWTLYSTLVPAWCCGRSVRP